MAGLMRRLSVKMLKTRVLTAVVLLGIFFTAVFIVPPKFWVIFCSVVTGLAAWEWSGLMRNSSKIRLLYGVVTAAASAGLVVALKVSHRDTGFVLMLMGLASGFWALLVPIWLSKQWRLPSHPAAWLIGWLVLLPTAMALVLLREIGPWLLLAVMALVWVADIAAYFCGKSFGKTKLAPSISPGKTREGAVGAVLGVLIYGVGVVALSGELPGRDVGAWFSYAALLVVLTVLSIEGDLFESLLKRQAGVKDSSGLLPGHGGVLDRIDSLTSTLPVVGLLLLIREVLG